MIDPKEALAILGYDSEAFEDLEAFKVQAKKDWLKATDAHMDEGVRGKVFGAQFGSMRTALKRAAKELEIEAEFDDLDPNKGVDLLAAQASARLKELREARKEGAPAKEIADLQKKYDDAQRYGQELKAAVEAEQAKYTQLETAIAEEKKASRIAKRYQEAVGKLDLREMNDLERTGFDDIIRRKFRIEEEDEREYVLNEKGERMRHPKKVHDFLTLEDAVRIYTEEQKLMKEQAPPAPQRRTIPMVGEQRTADRGAEQPKNVRKLAAR